jgi:serine transporter
MSSDVNYISSKVRVPGNRKFDTTWVLSLFGTAVGAGVLFLPINAGMGGFWPLVALAVIVGPMTWLAHRGLARFVLSSRNPGSDITEVVEEHFGAKAGILITLLYFFAIYPILLIYGVGITNTIDSLMVNQLGMASPPRVILSIVLIAALMAVMLTSERVGILLFLSLYLIPHWNTAALSQVPTAMDFTTTLWLTIPVLVFAFNHSPAISSFALSQRREYGNLADEKASQTLRKTSTILLAFVMLFVFSCVLSVTPADLMAAKQQNISMLSFLANKFDNPLISIFGPLVAILAISSSFFGHYLGAREGLHGLVKKIARHNGKRFDDRKLNKVIALFFLLSLWLVATLNPSILGMIESLGGPIIAMILFIMPMFAIHKVPALAKFRGKVSNIFVTVMGLVAISGLIASFF